MICCIWLVIFVLHITAATINTHAKPYNKPRTSNPAVEDRWTLTNWSQYDILDTPYNGPACILPNTTSGWSSLRNSDGSYFTSSKRPIILVTQNWDSIQVTTYIAQYMLEAMGYRVVVLMADINFNTGSELYANVVDLELEIWKADQDNWDQLVQKDKVAYNMGSIGYPGLIGLYVPTTLVDEYPHLGFDFWRFFINPDAIKLLTKSGSGPRFINPDGSPECNGPPEYCTNGTYVPSQCAQRESNCAEIWAMDPVWSPGMFQRLIDGLNLSATMNFLGGDGLTYFQKAIDSKQNFVMYGWEPNAFIASNNVTRILLPTFNPAQYKLFMQDRFHTNLYTDMPTDFLAKFASRAFANDFPELMPFANSFILEQSDMNSLLRSTVVNQYNYSTAACEWLRNNQQLWASMIPPVPTSAVSCPQGQGRYLTGVVFSCVVCPPGTFNLMPNNTDPCTPCPASLYCPGGAIVEVTAGLWMPSLSNVTNWQDPDAYKCPFSATCCSQSHCSAGTCNEGFDGLLCTKCSNPNAYMWNSKCHECASGGGTSFWLIIIGALCGSILLLFLPYEEAPTVEILFFYFQVSYYIFHDQIGGILSVPGLSTFLAVASLNIDGMVSDCTLPLSGVSKMLFRLFLPSLLMINIFLLYISLKVAQSFGILSATSSGSFAPSHLRGQTLSLICFRALIVVLTFVVMPLVDACLELLQCSTIQNNYVLTMSPQIQCFTEGHIGIAVFAVIILVLLLVALPAGIWFLLQKLRRSNNIIYEREGISNAQRLFQCLYIIFKPEMYFMLPITIMEKGVTSILFTLLVKYNEQTQLNVFIIFLGFLCLTRIYWQPYGNHLEAYLNREVSLGILVMIAFRQYTEQYGVYPLVVVQIAIVTFLPLLLHVIRWMQHHYAKHETAIKEGISKLSGSKAGQRSTGQLQSSLEVKVLHNSIEKLSGNQLALTGTRYQQVNGRNSRLVTSQRHGSAIKKESQADVNEASESDFLRPNLDA